ncbi:MAG: hypothetical protein LBO20_05790 [Bifidobacteriaceae bacterium]|nr:hypothetical protein [Bifidobacteriaceae bacterium]
MAAQVREQIEAVSGVEVSDFDIPDKRLGESYILGLQLAPTRTALSAAELVAVVEVLGEYRNDYSAMRKSQGVRIVVNGDRYISVGWSSPSRGAEASVVSIGSDGTPAYDAMYCEFPELELLEVTGSGSDFTRIAECSPKLESLWITGWEDAVGYDGLAGLGGLNELGITGTVEDINDLPRLESLKSLRLHLADDTPENHQRVQAMFPDCHIVFEEFPR